MDAENISAGSYYFTNGGGNADSDAPQTADQVSEPAATSVNTTQHGLQQLAERDISAAEAVLTKTGETFRQADGATAYLKQTAPGRYNVIVEGERGVITGLKSIRTSAVVRLARRYGWDWIP